MHVAACIRSIFPTSWEVVAPHNGTAAVPRRRKPRHTGPPVGLPREVMPVCVACQVRGCRRTGRRRARMRACMWHACMRACCPSARPRHVPRASAGRGRPEGRRRAAPASRRRRARSRRLRGSLPDPRGILRLPLLRGGVAGSCLHVACLSPARPVPGRGRCRGARVRGGAGRRAGPGFCRCGGGGVAMLFPRRPKKAGRFGNALQRTKPTLPYRQSIPGGRTSPFGPADLRESSGGFPGYRVLVAAELYRFPDGPKKRAVSAMPCNGQSQPCRTGRASREVARALSGRQTSGNHQGDSLGIAYWLRRNCTVSPTAQKNGPFRQCPATDKANPAVQAEHPGRSHEPFRAGRPPGIIRGIPWISRVAGVAATARGRGRRRAAGAPAAGARGRPGLRHVP